MGQSHINSGPRGTGRTSLDVRRRGSVLPASRTLLAWFTRIGVATFLSALASSGSVAQETSDGIRVMAREKSLAQQFQVIMNDFGQKDINQYAKGVMLYAQAKAEFDGLITQLEHELEQPKPPSQSEKFEAELNEAVAKRVAFTSFVTDTLVLHTEGAQKGIAGDFIKGSGDLIKALTDAGIVIWREFRSGGEARRKEIRQELESLRWLQFTAPSGK